MSRTVTANAPTPGQYSVYLPQAKKQQYLAFKTLAEAQAAVKAKKAGVILDPAGKLDPTVQTWSGWNSYQAQFPAAVVLTPGAMPGAAQPGQPNQGPIAVTASSSTPVGAAGPSPTQQPTARRYNVWVPSALSGGLTSGSGTISLTSRYFAFRTAAEAQAQVTRLGFGVILDPHGQLDATQPWQQAGSYAAQLLNDKLTAAPTAKKVNAWFPAQWLSGLGLNDSSPFAANGAYLAFDSVQEACAHVQARGLGVVLDQQGRYDASTPQGWHGAQQAAAMLLNPQLTASRTPDKHAVYFPIAFVSNLGANHAGALDGGAYLAFDSAQEAQAHAQLRGVGLVLDPQGKPDATQPNNGATQYAAELLNPKVTATRTAHKPAVWFSASYASSLGLKDPAAYAGGAYLAFDSAQEAQAHALERTFGVVLDPQGNLDATQPNPRAAQEGAERLNAKLKTAPTANKVSVWFPPQLVTNLGLPDSASFAATGAYLAFDSLGEAVAHAQARTFGVVLDQHGHYDAVNPQPWNQAGQYGAQLLHDKLTPTRTPNQYSVWLPSGYMSHLGLSSVTALAQGAYLAFDSAQGAQAHAKSLGFGAVLDPQGKLDATQPNSSAPHDAAQLLNSKLKTAPTANQVSVWFPPQYLGSLGLTDTSAFTTSGAYLAFDSVPEAVAHVRARMVGVLLDTQGRYERTIPQQWSQAGQYGAQLLNPLLTASPTAHKHAVWIPPSAVHLLNLSDPNAFPNGAYLAFDSAQEAQAHVLASTYGVVLDAQGQLAATQPWSGSGVAIAQRLNNQLKAAPTPNKVNVWFPPSYAGALGLADAAPYSLGGAYLAFDSAQEAAAHVQARTIGVVLDAKGQFDTTTPQPWSSAALFGLQLLNPKLTGSQTAKQHAVWFPQAYVSGLGLADARAFTRGAYLSFGTAQEALDHAKLRGFGVVVDPKGEPNATQPWNQAGQYIAQRTNAQLTQAPTAGKFNVWFPADQVDSLGLDSGNTTFSGGAYLAFDTLAAAQAHAKERTFGVVLNQRGDFDASLQNWNQAERYAAQLLNPQLKTQPTANRFNVWFPASALYNLGLADPGAFTSGGAYLAFSSAAEAADHAKARGAGAVLNKQGEFDTSVPQPAASLYDQQLRALINAKLVATRPTKGVSVFFPAQQLQQLGQLSNPGAFTQGAYLPFESTAAAIAHVQSRGLGAVLDAQGELEPKQGSNMTTMLLAQQLNAQLKATRTPGKVNVWFPKELVDSLQLGDTSPFAAAGAYLAFDSLKAAQTQVESRGFGVILDAQGAFDVSQQTWQQAGRYGAQLLNRLVATKPTQGPYVFFPGKVVAQLGVADTAPYASGGAFLSFSSVQEAKEHATTRDLGLVYDAKGQYDAANQGWTLAGNYAPLVAVWPPPAMGPEAQTAISGVADILGVYAKATKGGAHFVVRTHNAQLNEQLRYELYLSINGSDMKVKDLGSSQMGPGYMHDAAFDLSYAEMNTILGVLQGTSVKPGTTEFAVKVMWPAGHDQGANGAGGRGAHRFPAP